MTEIRWVALVISLGALLLPVFAWVHASQGKINKDLAVVLSLLSGAFASIMLGSAFPMPDPPRAGLLILAAAFFVLLALRLAGFLRILDTPRIGDSPGDSA